MIIQFPCAMSFDVLYAGEDGQPLAVPHTFEGQYTVDEVAIEEPRFGFSVFTVIGDQKDLTDGGIFEVPNPAFNEVIT